LKVYQIYKFFRRNIVLEVGFVPLDDLITGQVFLPAVEADVKGFGFRIAAKPAIMDFWGIINYILYFG